MEADWEAAGQQFQAPGDDTEIERTATATLLEFGLQPVSIAVLHPLDTALEVIATIPTPEAMNGRLAELQSALTGTPISYEGVCLEVRLPDGNPIAELSTAFRGGRGSQWERPDLADILGGPPHGLLEIETVPRAISADLAQVVLRPLSHLR